MSAVTLVGSSIFTGGLFATPGNSCDVVLSGTLSPLPL
jgi:hypothetical protein